MNVYELKECQISIRESDDIRKIYLELTSECNFECEMCFRHGFIDSFGSMTDDTLNRFLDEIKSLPHLKEVVIGGIGEPLLHPGFPDLIDQLKRHDIRTTITSNGALVRPHLDFLVEKRVDALYLSFETGDIGHANETEIFELARVMDLVKKKRGIDKPDIHFSMVVTRDNIKDLDRIADLLSGRGVSTIFMSNLLPTAPRHDSLTLCLNPEPEEIKRFKNHLFKKVLLEKTRCTTPRFEILTERYCEFVEQHSLVIRWDGEISPCYRFLHSTEEIIEGRRKEIRACSFGNIQRASLLEIWNDRDYAWFRFQVHNSTFPSCVDCSLKDGCEFIKSTKSDCWGNENTCADCLWARGIIRCP